MKELHVKMEKAQGKVEATCVLAQNLKRCAANVWSSFATIA